MLLELGNAGEMLTVRQYFREYVYNPYRALCKAYPNEVQYFPFV